jgi:phage host-nuclease inhibitor protein Gam
MAESPTPKQARAERAAEQERRAQAAIEAISAGGDVSEEALRLSNEFTDRHAARLGRFLRRT